MLGDGFLRGAAHPRQVPAGAVGGAERPGRPRSALGELGEIRITRVDPEQMVEWQAGETSGTVHIKPSGWGTRVTLTATRELVQELGAGSPSGARAGSPQELAQDPPQELAQDPPVEASASPEAVAGPPAAEQPEPALDEGLASEIPPPPAPLGELPAEAPAPPGELEPGLAIWQQQWHEPVMAVQPEDSNEVALEVEVLAHEHEPPPRLGLFSRLFRRRRRPADKEAEASDRLETEEREESQPMPGTLGQSEPAAEATDLAEPATEAPNLPKPATEAAHRARLAIEASEPPKRRE